jgi:flagellar assembly protein FliH
MTARAKYLFDVDFGAGAAPQKANTLSLEAHEIALKEARAQGFREGFSAAQAEARSDAARSTATSLERIASAVALLGPILRDIEGRLEAEAVEVAVAAAKKLAPALIDREPLAEISALVANCLAHLTNAPHVVVRVNVGVYPEARERLEALVRTHGFDGRLVVLAEPEIAPGDCRVEWADGGMVRDRAAVERSVDDAVNRYLAARPRGPERTSGGSGDE